MRKFKITYSFARQRDCPGGELAVLEGNIRAMLDLNRTSNM